MYFYVPITLVIYTLIQYTLKNPSQALFWAYLSLCSSWASFSHLLIQFSVMAENVKANTVRVDVELRYTIRQIALRDRPSNCERGSGTCLSDGCVITIRSRPVSVLNREGSGKRMAVRLSKFPLLPKFSNRLGKSEYTG